MSYLAPPESGWDDLYREESGRIAAALGETVLDIQHIGSTAVPGIWAKPILDIAVRARSFPVLDDIERHLEALGYEYRWDINPGPLGWHYFVLREPRVVHLHVFGPDGGEFDRHVMLRDYLRAFPEAARRYDAEKQRLAAVHPEDKIAYTQDKGSIVRELEDEARAWLGERTKV
ncbi:MAG TPA: GrpB family protein [Deinococcales bacterium]|nr:GrpB family protein [Deinococcales bacterium]